MNLSVPEKSQTETLPEVMALAQRDGRLLLTEDKDFGDLVFRHGQQVLGIVLLRIDATLSVLRAQRLDATIARFGESFFGRYVTVEAARLRSRPLRG